jgi:peptidoglycan/xylan/chitin deacetylase (PgdA/CDA1 family)
MVRRRARRPVGASLALGGAVFAHLAPSVAVLGQWVPPALGLPPALPAGLCRWRGPASSNIALTFDDGPSPESTPAVLDRLRALEVRATFFVLGELVGRAPEVVARIVDEGHEVALHGNQHVHHLWRSYWSIERDLSAGLAVLAGVGVQPRFFRPPYGQISAGTLLAARRLRLETVLWSAWGREWRDPHATSVARRVCAGLGPGAIVLLHDTDHTAPPGTSSVALQALPLVVEECARRGLNPVTLGELVGARPGGGHHG